MRATWARQGIRQRVVNVIAIAAVVVLVTGLAAVSQTVKLVHDLERQVDVLDPASLAARAVLGALLDQETGVRGYVLSADEGFLEPYHRGEVLERDAWRRLVRATRTEPELSDGVFDVREATIEWHRQVATPSIDGVRAGQPDTVRLMLASGSGKARFDRVRTSLAALNVHLDRLRDAARGDLRHAVRRLVVMLGLVGAEGLTAGLFTWLALQRWVSRPVARLEHQVRQVADGNLSRRIVEEGPPELARLGSDVEAMRQRLVTELDDALRAREALEQRGEVVLRLQESLAPNPSEAPDLPYAARLMPAEGVLAGDWYDLSRMEDRVVLALVDVAGHGADAGLFAYRLKALLAAAVRSGMSCGDVLAWTAAQLGETEERFATVVVAQLDPATGAGCYASAGHHPPLVLGRDRQDELAPTGPLLGPLPGTWETAEFTLHAGDDLVVYTDGLIEARDPSGDEFGTVRLCEALAGRLGDGPDAMADECIAAVRAHVGGSRLSDDCTLVILGWPGAGVEVAAPGGPPIADEQVLPGQSLEVHLAAEPSSVPLARRLVRDALAQRAPGRSVETAELCTSEVVTNAVRHGRGDVTLRLEETADRLRVTVQDDSVAIPIKGDAAADAESGRGLSILSALAADWGTTWGPSGKCVWFELERAPSMG